MPRRLRVNSGGIAYHVLNRAVGRGLLFNKAGDYLAFEKVLGEVHRRLPVRLLSYCLMPNHWHLVLWPRADGELSEFMRLVTVTHTQRWHAHHGSAGTGPLYQGRFKSFPIQKDGHLLSVCRYVERNALRANLKQGGTPIERAEQWRWGSLNLRGRDQPPWLALPEDWPVELPADWKRTVNRPQSQKEIDALQTSVRRGRPFGDDRWQAQTARAMRLESTLRPRGRPGKKQAEAP
jgi:putative transposase